MSLGASVKQAERVSFERDFLSNASANRLASQASVTPALLEDTIAVAARVAPRQAQLALGTVKQVLRDAIKRGQRVDPALLEVKAPRHEERDPVFLSAAEVKRLASLCAQPQLITFAALSGLRLGRCWLYATPTSTSRMGAWLFRARRAQASRGEPRRGSVGVSTCAHLPSRRCASNSLPGARMPRVRLPVAAFGQRVELGQLPSRCVREDSQTRGG
jgi:hypothetical protein